MPAYRSALTELGEIYRRHFGRRYVASALLGVERLFDEAAMVELVGVAVLAEVGGHRQVIVFTHDTRLSDALRGLGLPADIRTINRDAMSNVWISEGAA